MLNKIVPLLLCIFVLIACQKEDLSLEDYGTDLSKEVDATILDQIMFKKEVFNWNEQADDFICKALPLTKQILVVGFETNINGKKNVDQFISDHPNQIDLINKNEKLGVYFLKLENCTYIEALRNLEGIQYIELDYYPKDISPLINDVPIIPINNNQREASSNNSSPGDYIIGSGPYLDFLKDIASKSSERAYNENLDKVYDMGYYGTSEMGIAVIDNGVKAEKMAYLTPGPGGYSTDGFYVRQWWNPSATDDGIHPQSSDGLGIWQLIEPAFNHGTGMSENIYEAAPFAKRRTIRASTTYMLLSISQMKSITNAITALADDSEIRIVSMSMAGPFVNNQMTSAINYFNSKNKLFFAAAGSSIPVIRDLLGMLFPGRNPATISVTGIEKLEDTNGQMVLGINAHGGIRNDFVIEDAESSSTATSTLAGMIAVIWSINPDLNRDDLIQMMIEQSGFYQSQGSKHSKFGWGKIDMHALALDVEQSL